MHNVYGKTFNQSSCRTLTIHFFRFVFDFQKIECFFSVSYKDNREAATEEDQFGDIYLMYLERHLLELLESKS